MLPKFLKRKNNEEDCPVLDIKLYYKASIIKNKCSTNAGIGRQIK